MKTIHQHKGVRFAVEANEFLRERESEAVVWTVEGKTRDEIAAIMDVSPNTVKKHLERAKEALEANNIASLVALAFSKQLVTVLSVFIICLQAGLLLVATPSNIDLRRAPRTSYNQRINLRSGRTRLEEIGIIPGGAV